MNRSDSAGHGHGYDAVSEEFVRIRTESKIGAAIVSAWAEGLPYGGDVLDLGSGHGVPISELLLNAGFSVYGVDSSPSLVAEFRARFPGAPVECARVEDSQFFSRSFDGVVAWGLLFLLPRQAQADLIHKIARVLKPGGRLLFTAPVQAAEWEDLLTGQTSRSLGAATYRQIIEAAGLQLAGEAEDEGENHYYFAERPGTGVPAKALSS